MNWGDVIMRDYWHIDLLFASLGKAKDLQTLITRVQAKCPVFWITCSLEEWIEISAYLLPGGPIEP